MGRRIFHGFNCGHDQRKRSTLMNNSSINSSITIMICPVSFPSGTLVVWSSLLRRNSTRRLLSSAASSYKKFIQPYFQHPGTPFSTAIFPFERPTATRKKILAWGLYHLGHGNSYVSIGLSSNGIACYPHKTLKTLKLCGIRIMTTSVHDERPLTRTELPALIVS